MLTSPSHLKFQACGSPKAVFIDIPPCKKKKKLANQKLQPREKWHPQQLQTCSEIEGVWNGDGLANRP